MGFLLILGVPDNSQGLGKKMTWWTRGCCGLMLSFLGLQTCMLFSLMSPCFKKSDQRSFSSDQVQVLCLKRVSKWVIPPKCTLWTRISSKRNFRILLDASFVGERLNHSIWLTTLRNPAFSRKTHHGTTSDISPFLEQEIVNGFPQRSQNSNALLKLLCGGYHPSSVSKASKLC